MKNPPNPNPGVQQPPGMSKHPGRNRRNRAHRKRAKLNQTKIVFFLLYFIIEVIVRKCCNNGICIWCYGGYNNSLYAIKQIKRNS